MVTYDQLRSTYSSRYGPLAGEYATKSDLDAWIQDTNSGFYGQTVTGDYQPSRSTYDAGERAVPSQQQQQPSQSSGDPYAFDGFTVTRSVLQGDGTYAIEYYTGDGQYAVKAHIAPGSQEYSAAKSWADQHPEAQFAANDKTLYDHLVETGEVQKGTPIYTSTGAVNPYPRSGEENVDQLPDMPAAVDDTAEKMRGQPVPIVTMDYTRGPVKVAAVNPWTPEEYDPNRDPWDVPATDWYGAPIPDAYYDPREHVVEWDLPDKHLIDFTRVGFFTENTTGRDLYDEVNKGWLTLDNPEDFVSTIIDTPSTNTNANANTTHTSPLTFTIGDGETITGPYSPTYIAAQRGDEQAKAYLDYKKSEAKNAPKNELWAAGDTLSAIIGDINTKAMDVGEWMFAMSSPAGTPQKTLATNAASYKASSIIEGLLGNQKNADTLSKSSDSSWSQMEAASGGKTGTALQLERLAITGGTMLLAPEVLALDVAGQLLGYGLSKAGRAQYDLQTGKNTFEQSIAGDVAYLPTMLYNPETPLESLGNDAMLLWGARGIPGKVTGAVKGAAGDMRGIVDSVGDTRAGQIAMKWGEMTGLSKLPGQIDEMIIGPTVGSLKSTATSVKGVTYDPIASVLGETVRTTGRVAKDTFTPTINSLVEVPGTIKDTLIDPTIGSLRSTAGTLKSVTYDPLADAFGEGVRTGRIVADTTLDVFSKPYESLKSTPRAVWDVAFEPGLKSIADTGRIIKTNAYDPLVDAFGEGVRMGRIVADTTLFEPVRTTTRNMGIVKDVAVDTFSKPVDSLKNMGRAVWDVTFDPYLSFDIGFEFPKTFGEAKADLKHIAKQTPARIEATIDEVWKSTGAIAGKKAYAGYNSLLDLVDPGLWEGKGRTEAVPSKKVNHAAKLKQRVMNDLGTLETMSVDWSKSNRPSNFKNKAATWLDTLGMDKENAGALRDLAAMERTTHGVKSVEVRDILPDVPEGFDETGSTVHGRVIGSDYAAVKKGVTSKPHTAFGSSSLIAQMKGEVLKETPYSFGDIDVYLQKGEMTAITDDVFDLMHGKSRKDAWVANKGEEPAIYKSIMKEPGVFEAENITNPHAFYESYPIKGVEKITGEEAARIAKESGNEVPKSDGFYSKYLSKIFGDPAQIDPTPEQILEPGKGSNKTQWWMERSDMGATRKFQQLQTDIDALRKDPYARESQRISKDIYQTVVAYKGKRADQMTHGGPGKFILGDKVFDRFMGRKAPTFWEADETMPEGGKMRSATFRELFEERLAKEKTKAGKKEPEQEKDVVDKIISPKTTFQTNIGGARHRAYDPGMIYKTAASSYKAPVRMGAASMLTSPSNFNVTFKALWSPSQAKTKGSSSSTGIEKLLGSSTSPARSGSRTTITSPSISKLMSTSMSPSPTRPSPKPSPYTPRPKSPSPFNIDISPSPYVPSPNPSPSPIPPSPSPYKPPPPSTSTSPSPSSKNWGDRSLKRDLTGIMPGEDKKKRRKKDWIGKWTVDWSNPTDQVLKDIGFGLGAPKSKKSKKSRSSKRSKDPLRMLGVR